MLEDEYREVAIKKRKVYEGFKHFCDGRASINDDPHYG
jgi:hypothetical protein